MISWLDKGSWIRNNFIFIICMHQLGVERKINTMGEKTLEIKRQQMYYLCLIVTFKHNIWAVNIFFLMMTNSARFSDSLIEKKYIFVIKKTHLCSFWTYCFWKEIFIFLKLVKVILILINITINNLQRIR